MPPTSSHTAYLQRMMDQEEESAGVRKRKRKPREENGGLRKRNHGGGGGGGGGEPQQQDKVAVAAALVAKVAECVQKEEEADYEGITEESVAEMMRWLALDLPSPAAVGGGVVAAAGTSPPVAAAASAGAGAGYVTLQGSMAESCGPSFSGSASTVMASVDARFVAPVVPWPRREAAPGLQEEEEEQVDDEWVAGLLTDGPAESEGWTGWYCAQ